MVLDPRNGSACVRGQRCGARDCVMRANALEFGKKQGGGDRNDRGQLKSCGSTAESHDAAWPERPRKSLDSYNCLRHE